MAVGGPVYRVGCPISLHGGGCSVRRRVRRAALAALKLPAPPLDGPGPAAAARDFSHAAEKKNTEIAAVACTWRWA